MRSTASVPPRFINRSLDGYRADTPTAERALIEARRLVRGEIRNLVLIGPTGVGKTHLAAGIVDEIAGRLLGEYDSQREAMDDDRERRWPRQPELPEWCNVTDLIVSLRLDMDRPLDDRDASMRALHLRDYRGLVVLDDLGREKVSDWTGETIYALVNARYEALLPTIVTSNLTETDLAASPYWPVISRLAEDGALVAVTAPDYRLRRP